MPLQAALASLVAFTVGGVLPLLAAVFIRDARIRLYVVLVSETPHCQLWCCPACRTSMGEGVPKRVPMDCLCLQALATVELLAFGAIGAWLGAYLTSPHA